MLSSRVLKQEIFNTVSLEVDLKIFTFESDGHLHKLTMTKNIDSWGDSRKHYADNSTQAHSDYELDQLGNIKKHLPPGSRDNVNRYVRRWNQHIRQQLTKEMGFNLRGRRVPIRIVDGLPEPLSKRIRADDILAVLALNSSLLTGVVDGTKFMDTVWNRVNQQCRGAAKKTEVRHVRESAEEWLRQVEKRGIHKVLYDINEDVLGAYFFRREEIRIYWIAIAIFSALWSVPIEALTFVVLAHELAHAYSHLGYDIDELDWPTSIFASTDVAIVEGIAQFYTELVCENMKNQIPDCTTTFGTLLNH